MNLWGIVPGAATAIARPRGNGGSAEGVDGTDGSMAAGAFALVLAGQSEVAVPVAGGEASAVAAGDGVGAGGAVGSGVWAGGGAEAAAAAENGELGAVGTGVETDTVNSAVGAAPTFTTASDAAGGGSGPSRILSAGIAQRGIGRTAASEATAPESATATAESASGSMPVEAAGEAVAARAGAGDAGPGTAALAHAPGSGSSSGNGSASTSTAAPGPVVAPRTGVSSTPDATPVQLGVTLPADGDVPETAAGATAASSAAPSSVSAQPASGPSVLAPVPIPTPAPPTPTAPAVATAPTASPEPPASSTPTTPPLAPQLRAPVLSLVAAEPGRHTMVLRVSPESLGPITVTAHISGSAVTVELATGTAAAHDALRAVLGDLRRELAALAPFSSISLAAGDDPSRTPPSPTTAGQHAAAGAPGGSGGHASGGGPSRELPQQATESPGGRGRAGPPSDLDGPGPAGSAEPRRPVSLGAGRIDLYA